MQTSFYRFLKNSLILKNLETQPTLPNGLIFSQHKEKKKKIGGTMTKAATFKVQTKALNFLLSWLTQDKISSYLEEHLQ